MRYLAKQLNLSFYGTITLGEDMTSFSLTFEKAVILDALRKNKYEHIEIVKEAQVGYRRKLEELLKEKLHDLQEGREVTPHLNLALPAHHVDEFNNAIEMLEMSVDEKIELEESQFKCYIRNEWHWDRQFLVANSSYSGMAQQLLDTRRGDGY